MEKKAWMWMSMIMAAAASAATAQTRHLTAEDLGCGCDEPLNRFGISYRAGFNITTKFKHLGGLASPNNPGPATGGAVDRFYDDGYNRVDNSGNTGDITTFWGYENSSQYDPGAFGGTGGITMSSTSASGIGASKSKEEDPQHGAELTYNRQLGKTGNVRWGAELAVNYMNLTIHDNSTLFGDALRTSDSYALNNVVPPQAPYHATKEQLSGPVLSSVPVRTMTTIVNGATVNGSRRFDADIFGMRVGPYMEIPVCRHFAMNFSGGLAAAWINSEFQFDESTSVNGSSSGSARGSGRHDGVLVGGYASGNLMFNVTEAVDVFVGAQYQALGQYIQNETHRVAQVDLRKSVFLTAGVGFSF
jgi:hypothetical protein